MKIDKLIVSRIEELEKKRVKVSQSSWYAPYAEHKIKPDEYWRIKKIIQNIDDAINHNKKLLVEITRGIM
ncbi:hypothetical protein KDA08_05620 [Candidatus Saccharibacteria bacterium]|nr:hypothetical protein [Candidatus Saccharibacteria bacterium]